MDSPFAMDAESYGFRMSNRQRRNTSGFTAAKGSETRRRTIRTSPGASNDQILAVARQRRRRRRAAAMAETEAGSCSYDVLTACFILVAQSRPRNTNRTAPRHPRGGRQIRIPSTRSVNQIPSAPGRGRPNATRRRAVSWRRKASRRKPPA